MRIKIFISGYTTVLLCIALTLISNNANGQTIEQLTASKTVIAGIVPSLPDSAIIFVTLGEAVFGADGHDKAGYTNQKQRSLQQEKFSVRVIDHQFKLVLTGTTETRYFSLISPIEGKRGRLLNLGMTIIPGDSLMIIEKSGMLFFSGTNSPRYECEYELMKCQQANKLRYGYIADTLQSRFVTSWFLRLDSVALLAWNILETYKPKLKTSDYNLLKTELVMNCQREKFSYLNTNGCLAQGDPFDLVKYFIDYRCLLWNKIDLKKLAQSNTARHSLQFLEYLVNQYQYDSCFISCQYFSLEKCQQYFSAIYGKGPTLEWITYSLVIFYKGKGRDVFGIIDTASKKNYIKNPAIRKFFADLKKWNSIGVDAFDFSLPGMDGKTVHLSDFRGKAVLLDFWFIGCGPCAGMYPYLDSVRRLYNADDLVVIAICLDYARQGKNAWLAAINKKIFTSTEEVNILAEGAPDGTDPEVGKVYGVNACPQIFLVNKDGKMMKRPIRPDVDGGKDLVSMIDVIIGAKE